MPLFQKVDEKAVEPLDEMLATKLGYAYMYRHCCSEFSSENIMCWRAIDEFKRKTTLDGWREICMYTGGGTALMC